MRLELWSAVVKRNNITYELFFLRYTYAREILPNTYFCTESQKGIFQDGHQKACEHDIL